MVAADLGGDGCEPHAEQNWLFLRSRNGPVNLVYNEAETQSMPIFEYTCQSCNHRFEHLTRADREPVCPACEGHTLSKHLSTFAVGANGSAPRADFAASGSCGSCGDPRGPGACSMN